MGTPDDLGQQIFAYRAFDLRDRFPQPLETFRDALECLQSDDAYMAAMSGEIMAYLRGGGVLNIPVDFFLHRSGNSVILVAPEENNAVCDAVDAWLQEALIVTDNHTPHQKGSMNRPYRLELLLDQCDINAEESDDISTWRNIPEVGREQTGAGAVSQKPPKKGA